MALYHQLKFPSTFIEYRSVSEWKWVIVISNFDSLEAAPGVRHVEPSGSAATVLGLNNSLSWNGKINTIWLFLWQDFCC